MKKKRFTLAILSLITIVLLGIGTFSYFRRTTSGNIIDEVANLVLIVNEANSELNEEFKVVLQRSESENFVMPGDSGTFDINIVSSGSSTDVAVTISISRINLPNNLKFYLDEEYTEELVTKTYILEHAATMEKTVPVYWYWDGTKDNENDTLFIEQKLIANVNVTATAATFYSELLAQDVTLDTNVNFRQSASATNGEGLMMVNGTEDDKYPIVYYRGDVTNNNVIFADFCWLIVRTTETGGVKLIYNGPVNDDGSCTNFSGVGGMEATNATDVYPYIDKSAFNQKLNSPIYVGYMYNDTNTYFVHSEGWTESLLFDVNGMLDTEGYAAHLTDNTIDISTGYHTQNLKDSIIKNVIDDWYEKNILNTNAKNLLEDTVWCNDRNVSNTSYPLESYNTNKRFSYSTLIRITENSNAKLALTCEREVDKFTVELANGNGDLTYPIGLLTADEIMMAGNTNYTNSKISYLSIVNESFWSMSPLNFNFSMSQTFSLGTEVLKSTAVNTSSVAVRPSVSLSFSTVITDGNGSFKNPYIVLN